MGNRAKRAEIARLLKKNGYGTKLYKGRKLKAYRMMSGHNLNSLLYLLQYKVGDLVSDYGHNHRIVELPTPEEMRHEYTNYCWGSKDRGRNCGWYLYSGFQFKYEHGWLSCGCGTCPDPAETREEIESRWINMDQEYVQQMQDNSREFRIYCWLKAGGHVHDENGVLLPEWRK